MPGVFETFPKGPVEPLCNMRNVTCILEKHLSLYIQKAEDPQKHYSLHTSTKTSFGPFLHKGLCPPRARFYQTLSGNFLTEKGGNPSPFSGWKSELFAKKHFSSQKTLFLGQSLTDFFITEKGVLPSPVSPYHRGPMVFQVAH